VKHIEYQSNGRPVAIDFDDLKEKLGYKTYKPRIGTLGQALIQATKGEHHRSIGWLKHQLDELFRKDRQKHKKKNRNGRNKK
jgi:hypothetical protein